MQSIIPSISTLLSANQFDSFCTFVRTGPPDFSGLDAVFGWLAALRAACAALAIVPEAVPAVGVPPFPAGRSIRANKMEVMAIICGA